MTGRGLALRPQGAPLRRGQRHNHIPRGNTVLEETRPPPLARRLLRAPSGILQLRTGWFLSTTASGSAHRSPTRARTARGTAHHSAIFWLPHPPHCPRHLDGPRQVNALLASLPAFDAPPLEIRGLTPNHTPLAIAYPASLATMSFRPTLPHSPGVWRSKQQQQRTTLAILRPDTRPQPHSPPPQTPQPSSRSLPPRPRLPAPPNPPPCGRPQAQRLAAAPQR